MDRDLRVEVMEPPRASEMSSEILRAAWLPPSLYYSPEYVRWQFTFPGPPATAAIAFLGGRPVGCAAVTPRRLRSGGFSINTQVLSFVAVVPDARGRGVAQAVYAALLEQLRDAAPLLAFSEINSPGGRLLAGALSKAGFVTHRLAPCRAVGYRPRPGQEPARLEAVEIDDDRIVRALIDNAASRSVLWNDPTAEQWAHYRADPRRRYTVGVFDATGAAAAAAMVVITEMQTSAGVEDVPMLESIWSASDSADALRAIFEFAARSCDTAIPTIVASNVSHLDASLVRGAGARALPSTFEASLFLRERTPELDAISSVNLEVL